MGKILVLAVITVFIFGCNIHRPPAPINCLPGTIAYSDVEPDLYAYSGTSGIKYEFVARSQSELDALGIATINPVDFSSKMVVGFYLLYRNSCYDYEMIGIETDCNKVYVEIMEKDGPCDPLGGCLSIIWPELLVMEIDKYDLPVEFVYTPYPCP